MFLKATVRVVSVFKSSERVLETKGSIGQTGTAGKYLRQDTTLVQTTCVCGIVGGGLRSASHGGRVDAANEIVIS